MKRNGRLRLSWLEDSRTIGTTIGSAMFFAALGDVGGLVVPGAVFGFVLGLYVSSLRKDDE